jgi:hypothetical protein
VTQGFRRIGADAAIYNRSLAVLAALQNLTRIIRHDRNERSNCVEIASWTLRSGESTASGLVGNKGRVLLKVRDAVNNPVIISTACVCCELR